jgi:hypothetical protein
MEVLECGTQVKSDVPIPIPAPCDNCGGIGFDKVRAPAELA